MRSAPRRDSNEKEIISALRGRGASVIQLDDAGIPDLLVGYAGQTVLAEVKTAAGTLTPRQIDFFSHWRGGAAVVIRSVEEAQALLDALSKGQTIVTTWLYLEGNIELIKDFSQPLTIKIIGQPEPQTLETLGKEGWNIVTLLPVTERGWRVIFRKPANAPA